ncbi:hypothetical protein ACN2WE_03275 [Streptomyces sp. cg28]|uniref:Rv1733c family protein n=1 Tax=Streptomyces sp. cg28 TaxID=3403457 RepID=UPI003B20DF07
MRWGWLLRRNPLLRRSDVVEAWTVLCVTASVLVGAPVTALAVGAPVVAGARAESRVQHRERHPASARLLRDAPPAVTWAGSSGSVRTMHQVPVRWKAADGTVGTGTARVPAGTTSGEPARIWLDRRGRLTEAPLDTSDIWLRGVSAGAAAGSGVVTVALLAGWSVRRHLDRGRLAAWDRAWAAWV